MSHNVVFLLGAGASLGAGLPSTEEITKVVLSGENVVRRFKKKTYGFATGGEDSPQQMQRWHAIHVQPIVDYLRSLRCLTSSYYKNRRVGSLNYEDLYYLGQQVRGALFRYVDNPLLYEVAESVHKDICDRERARRGKSGSHICVSAREVMEGATEYIQGITRELLAKPPGSTDYLRLIAESWRDDRVSHMAIATLNHDRVIDAFLKRSGIPYTDGFQEPSEPDGFRSFRTQVFDQENAARVLKLHGAVDWIQRWSPDDLWDWDMMIAVDPSAPDVMEVNGYRVEPVPLLIGTQNKVEDYTLNRILSDLQHEFLHCLDVSDLMVIAGYGFGDRGINARIVHWMYGHRGRRLVVIDPALEKTKDSPGVREFWETWLEPAEPLTLPRGVEDIRWEHVLRGMGD